MCEKHKYGVQNKSEWHGNGEIEEFKYGTVQYVGSIISKDDSGFWKV